MARIATRQYWLGLSLLGALLATLLVGWWLGNRRHSVEVDAQKSQLEQAAALDEAEILRLQNDDLMRFIDESYTLLKEEGFHIQLALEQDADGRYRLRAETAELTAELKEKLREFNAGRNQPAQNPP